MYRTLKIFYLIWSDPTGPEHSDLHSDPALLGSQDPDPESLSLTGAIPFQRTHKFKFLCSVLYGKYRQSPNTPTVFLSHMEKTHKENKRTQRICQEYFAVFSKYANGYKLEPIYATMQPKSERISILNHLPRQDGLVEKNISRNSLSL